MKEDKLEQEREIPRWMSKVMPGFSETVRDGQRADNDDQWEANVPCIHSVIPTLNASSPSYAVITWKPSTLYRLFSVQFPE